MSRARTRSVSAMDSFDRTRRRCVVALILVTLSPPDG
jgi:hypothetical protein